MTAIPRPPPAARQRAIACVLLAVTLATLTPGMSTAAQKCPATVVHGQRFHDNGDGTVTDPVTGLVWMRCNVGQSWIGDRCTDPKAWFVMYSWKEAVKLPEKITFAGRNDWRVPSIDELASIVDSRCIDPSIDLLAFPTTPSWYYWSSTPFGDNPEYAWRIDFRTGKENSDLKSSVSYNIRLVRGTFTESTVASESSTPVGQGAKAEGLAADGIHDPETAGLEVLQTPEEGLTGFPRTATGSINWVQALEIGVIDPRPSLSGDGEMTVMDLDIILADTRSMPRVRFPHKAHTQWLTCSNCHPQIFVPKLGANPISMDANLLGNYCGRCHGRVAFSLFECDRCHSVPLGQLPSDQR